MQSLKFADPVQQRELWQLTGKQAKEAGSAINWQKDGLLYWKGTPYVRKSKQYRALIEGAYEGLYENSEFRKALLASKGFILVHTIGRWRKSRTILTVWEFCSILTRLRRRALAQERCEGKS